MSIISNEIIETLHSGGVIAYPTTTLPGLGCLPNSESLDSLFELKHRPSSQPVSLGVASLKQAEEFVFVPKIANQILQSFPAGSLTLILDAKTKLDQRLGGERVAVRVLANEIALELVKAIGPITATSANPSGVEPHYSVALAGKELGLDSKCIIEGNCPGGVPSTILSISKIVSDTVDYTVTIMREGVVPATDVNTWMMNYH